LALRPTLSAQRPIVLVLGLRGVPGVQGGIETHVRMLFPLLARLGWAVEVVQRSPFFANGSRRREWHGLRFVYLWSPLTPGVETAVHSLLGVFYAAVRRPAILHLHGIGPGFLAPLARLMLLRVVVTHHAFDYRREKWGPLAKAVMRAGEWLGMRFANERIAVSSVIGEHVRAVHRVAPRVIPNGAPKARVDASTAPLSRFNLEAGRYVLCVARLEPTKRQHDLLDAFEAAGLDGWRVVLVGAVDKTDPYTNTLLARAAKDPRIVLTDYQTGRTLRCLYSHAGLFVLPSSMEGHPIALLEAVSYGLPTLASAIPENLLIPLPRESYFPVGDAPALARLMRATVTAPPEQNAREATRRAVREQFGWRQSALATSDVYERVIGR
jgi:glycosyltransferase involved in cell wall biosynthesis